MHALKMTFVVLFVQEGVAYDPDDLLQRNTQNLMSAVSSLPELQEKKKVSGAG